MAEPTTDAANETIESRADADDKPLSSQFWLGEVKAAQKREAVWVKRAERVVARYRDERAGDRHAQSERRANILWSNTETLKSALYQGIGKPDVRRRFAKKGEDDRVARQAALVLERSLSYCADSYDTETQVECAVEDELLPGRGTAWVVYEAEIEEIEPHNEAAAEQSEIGEDASDADEADDYQGAPAQGPGGPQIHAQSVRVEHVYWRDFLTSAGRKWSDVWWVGRAHDYSRDELVQNFGEAHGKEVPLNSTVQGYESEARRAGKSTDNDTFSRARVWEIWDKSKKQRVYVAEGYKHILQSDDDPYRLKDFFPTVEPLWGIKTTSTLEPVPEYLLYQDQAEELDVVQTRLARLIEALKRRGVYDASAEGQDNQLSALANAADNQFLPYRNFAVLVEKGGLKNVFQTEDLEPIIAVIEKLQVHRQQLVQTIYEITGISDIMRGASDANETATAQRIKGQFGSMRMQRRQKKVQIFIRDLFRLKAEIIAEHFTREQLQEMTGIDMPLAAEQEQAKMALAAIEQQTQMAQQAAKSGLGAVQAPQVDPKTTMQLTRIVKAVPWEAIESIIRSDERRSYKVDIDTDALGRMDDQEEKAQRIEFLGAMQTLMEKTVPAVMTMPALAPLAKETASFTAGAFKAGRIMEEAFEDTFQQIEEQAKAQMAKGPQPSPEEKKVQLEAQAKQAEFQFRAKEAEQDRAIRQAELQQTAQLETAKLAHEMQLAEKKLENERILAERKLEIDMQMKAAEFDRQQAMDEQARAVEMEREDWDRHFKQSEFEAKRQDADINRQFEERKHSETMGLERIKHSGQMMESPVDDTGTVTLGNMLQTMQAATQQQAEAYTAAMAQQAELLAGALERIAEQNAQALKVATAPKRLVKDAKTGEKRVELMM